MIKFRLGALALMAMACSTGSAMAQDVAAGEKVFRQCRACHAVGDGAKHKVGPSLNEVFGRTAGTAEGYKYSDAMIAKGEEGLVWNEEVLTVYLAAPRDYVPGTKMAFAGLRKDQQIADVIAYLAQFSAETGS